MQLERLVLRNFRCYEQLRLELAGGLNLFLGPNASGKSTLLEAVFLLATTSSPRTTNERELIRWGADSATLTGRFILSERAPLETTLTLAPAADENGVRNGASRLLKSVSFDGHAVHGLRAAIGRVEAVFFSPDDLQTVKGSPGLRRRLLNTALAQMLPRYLDDLGRYRRALRQRNELLKSPRPDEASLAAWTTVLCEAGSQIAQDRADFVAQLQAEAGPLHQELSGGGELLEATYQGDLSEPDSAELRLALFRERLAQTAEGERRRGSTLVGPHRDDLALSVDGHSVRQFGSQGQQRTAALALKLAEARVMLTRTHDAPLLLLDDCLSELDPERIRRILDLTGQFQQILLTSASAEPLRATGAPDCRWHSVRGGLVESLA